MRSFIFIEYIKQYLNFILGKAFETVRSVMKKLNHALYRGRIYSKAPKGKNAH